MSEPMFIKYPLKITTLSPVHIGDAKERALSPYSDYFVDDDGRICYIHEQRMLEKLQEQNKLDKYLSELKKKQSNNRSDFSLRAFLLGEMGLSEEEVVRHRVENIGIGQDDRREIAVTSKVLGKAYIPGSSLKGALRTAILYDWLVNVESGGRALQSSFRNIPELQAVREQIQQLKRRGNKGSRHEWNKIRKRENNIIEAIFPEQELFGSIINNNDASRIRVADSSTILSSGIQITAAERIRLRPVSERSMKRNTSIPQPREVIAANMEFSVELNILPPFRSEALNYFVEGKDKLKECLGQYARDCVSNEIYLLEKSYGLDRSNQEKVDRLLDFYENLQNRLEANEWLLRIGTGKTIFDNSLLLALIYGDPQQRDTEFYFRELRELLFEVPEDHELFPVTRTLTADGLPMGWVKIEIE